MNRHRMSQQLLPHSSFSFANLEVGAGNGIAVLRITGVNPLCWRRVKRPVRIRDTQVDSPTDGKHKNENYEMSD